MSPEQADEEKAVDGRSDVYALGCVVHEMLAGEPPFTGPTPQAIIARHMHQPPPPIHVVRPAVPVGISQAIETALEKVPADRFRNAEEFVASLSKGLATPRVTHARTAPRAAIAAVAVLALAGGGLGVRTLVAGRAALDNDLIVIFPLVGVGEPDSAQSGWDVALAAGTALELAEPLRWIDGWLWLPNEARRDPARVDPATARRIAQERRAGRYASGVIRWVGDSVAVTLRVHDTKSDDILGQRTVWGSRDDPVPRIGLSAAVELLPSILEPGRAIDLSPLTDRSPAAVALTIQGDRAYRRSAFGEAYDLYRRAVEIDSLLALAAARGAVAGAWEEDHQGALRLASHAVRHEALLPQRYRHLVAGIEAYLSGQADTAVSRLHAALAAEPDWPEAATLLGEVYYHLFPSSATRSALQTNVSAARQALEAVADRDTVFAPPLPHLIELRLRGDSPREARTLLDRLERIAGQTNLTRRYELMLACIEDPRFQSSGWSSLAASDPQSVMSAGRSFAVEGAQPRCAEQAFQAVRALGTSHVWYYGASLALQSLWLAQGRFQETALLLDTMLAQGRNEAYPLAVFDAAVSGFFDSRAEAAHQVVLASYPEYRGANGVNLWLLGVWLAARGDGAMATRLAEIVGNPTNPANLRAGRLMATGLAGHAAEARGEYEEAIRAYSSLSPNAPLWRLRDDFHEALAPERLRLARAHLRNRDYLEAIAVATLFDHPAPVTYLAYLAPSLAIRLRAAEALRRTDLANRYRQRLIQLGWENADVPLSMTGPPLTN
jgi:tetratricopeptide (TPR) repeat protein